MRREDVLGSMQVDDRSAMPYSDYARMALLVTTQHCCRW